MSPRIFQVNAFSSNVNGGNPAGLCLLQDWLPEAVMQKIAAKVGLPETAFLLERQGVFEIRWFSPTTEVELCGHATLAAAWLLWAEYGRLETELVFRTQLRGDLQVIRTESGVQLSLPVNPAQPKTPPPELLSALNLGQAPIASLLCDNWLLRLPRQQEVAALTPDFDSLGHFLGTTGVIVTAAGDSVDFVSRYFVPGAGVDEDPVTGSAHATLTPYWANELGKTRLQAQQLSARGGSLVCELAGAWVLLTGEAVVVGRDVVGRDVIGRDVVS